LNFSIKYPPNWEVKFWDDKEQPNPYFGFLTDYLNQLEINFSLWKLDKGEDFYKFAYPDYPSKVTFYKKKRVNGFPAFRYGVHWYLEDGESYDLRQFVKIDKENVIDLMAPLPEKSFQEKDDKYKLVIEIMDTFVKY
ncbi:MAG: hypothetical protein ACM3YE_14780, partial [Bacteroidota bacterium]